MNEERKDYMKKGLYEGRTIRRKDFIKEEPYEGRTI
jgi:hypothetical protein